MEYTGLIWKHKINRKLTEQERRHHLPQKKRQRVEPIDQFSIIEKNDFFIEIVDKFYAFRGVMLIFMLVGILFMATFIFQIGSIAFVSPDYENRDAQLLAIGSIVLMFSAMLICFIWLALKESFTYTHWPVRLDRKNRMVYVFRHDGQDGVLEVPWDAAFFTIGVSKKKSLGVRSCYICGHVLDEDGLVQDTFAFGYTSTDRDIETRVLPQWEYFRRYMEEGANAVPEPQTYLPIADRRETIRFSFLKALQQYAYNWLTVVIFSPLAFIAGVGRVVAMKTSRIPRWPEHVKKACGGE